MRPGAGARRAAGPGGRVACRPGRGQGRAGALSKLFDASLRNRHGVLCDIDGVVMKGGEAVEGAGEALEFLREQGPLLFVTNNTSMPRRSLAERMTQKTGAPVAEGDIMTPALAASTWLRENPEAQPALLFVEEALKSEFEGVDTVEGGEAGASGRSCRSIVIGDIGAGWDYATLNEAFRALMAREPDMPRVKLLALGKSRFWNNADGLQLDVGPFAAALEYAASTKALTFGKPEVRFFKAAADHLGFPLQDLVMIGDDIETDIRAAQSYGAQGVLIMSEKYRYDLEDEVGDEIQPDAVLESIREIPTWW